MLTDEQIAIVKSNADRVKMIAVAGSGKTTTLLAKLKEDIANGVSPEQIAVMTFTNKAASQLKAKVPEIGIAGTYHSVYYKLLRAYKPGFSLQIIPQRIRDEQIKDIIANTYVKYSMKNFNENIRKYYDGDFDLDDVRNRDYKIVYKEYQRYLRSMGYIDYDLIEFEALNMMNDESFAAQIRHNYPVVYVDEFQDTNAIEYKLLTAWCPKKLFVVGDVAQNIYAFRGTTIDNIRNIAVDESYMLSKTFRCPVEITELANSALKQASISYHEKEMHTDKKGAPVEVYEESIYDIPSKVNAIVNKYSMIYVPDRIAVLCRTNYHVRQIAEMMDKPYSVVSRQLMWDTSIGILITMFLNACAAPKNHKVIEHFMVCTRQWERSEIIAMSRNRRYDESLVERFTEHPTMYEIPPLLGAEMNVYEKVTQLFNLLPIEAIYTTGEQVVQTKALDNCMKAIKHFSETVGGGELELLAWIAEEDEQSLVKDNNTVKLMTVHASKGLEFDVVILPYVGQGTFPVSSAPLDEELRLLYVAITRAKERLVLVRPYQPEVKDVVVDSIVSIL